jgi:hypothetical protein
MITLEIKNEPDENWNDRLLETDFGTYSQIKEASIKYDQENWKHLFLQFLDSNGEIVGQLLLAEFSRFTDQHHKTKTLIHKIKFLPKVLEKIPTLKNKVYRWAHGPVIFDPNKTQEIYQSFTQFLLKNKDHQVAGWQHPFLTDGSLILKNHFKLIPWSTFIVDLNQDKDTLFSKIEKDSGRKNIRKAEKKGVVIEEVNEKNLHDYFLLLKKSKGDRGGKSQDYDHFLQTWRNLKPTGKTGFLARKDGNAISGLSFSSICGHIIEGSVVRSQEDYTNKFYSQDLIRWKIIEWGVDNNMKYYNLAGFNPKPKSSKEEGIMKYKKKWGGKRYDYFGISLL